MNEDKWKAYRFLVEQGETPKIPWQTRLWFVSPNLQQIPRRPTGGFDISVNYSELEARILARMLSKGSPSRAFRRSLYKLILKTMRI